MIATQAGILRPGLLERLGWLLAVTFTSRGQQWAAERMAGSSGNSGQYVGWGTGSGGGAGSTDLVSAAPEGRATGSVSVSGSGSAAKYQVVGTITAAAPRAITEAGNFETSSTATIIVYGDFTVINLATGDKIEFTITIDPQ
jgi:hypothetical protein